MIGIEMRRVGGPYGSSNGERYMFEFKLTKPMILGDFLDLIIIDNKAKGRVSFDCGRNILATYEGTTYDIYDFYAVQMIAPFGIAIGNDDDMDFIVSETKKVPNIKPQYFENHKWNVYVFDVNRDAMKDYNIFRHGGFVKYLCEIYQKEALSAVDFQYEVCRELQYHFWSKCEYEIILTEWPPHEDLSKDVRKKIDVYDQIMLNIDRFIEWLYTDYQDLWKCFKEGLCDEF
jgi:hypothetical protein